MDGCIFHFRTHGTGGTYMWRGKHKITGGHIITSINL